MCVGSLAGATYLRYTELTSSNKSETAVHRCDPALSVLVMLVSRNVFHVVSALQSFALISLCMRMVLARPWVSVRVCHLLLLFFHPKDTRTMASGNPQYDPEPAVHVNYPDSP